MVEGVAPHDVANQVETEARAHRHLWVPKRKWASDVYGCSEVCDGQAATSSTTRPSYGYRAPTQRVKTPIKAANPPARRMESRAEASVDLASELLPEPALAWVWVTTVGAAVTVTMGWAE